MAAAPFGGLGGDANRRESQELAAIARAAEWLNSPRLTLESLQGKVVLASFCTYTCINWLRTLPYLRAWSKKYAPQLVHIGVHTPEFSFEKNLDNVRRAITQMRIEYPIVIDNDHSIWRAFKNQYWPALYFFDAEARVRQRHFGEGSYEQSEKWIQQLLSDGRVTGVSQSAAPVDAGGIEAAADWDNLRTPENYLGTDRTEHFGSPGGAEPNRRQVYAAPSRLGLNQWALVGEWTMAPETAVLNKANGKIVYRFHARDVHLVMGPSSRERPVRFRVSVDGRAPGAAHGLDIDEAGNGTAADQRLYQLIRQPAPILDRTVEIEFLDAGANAFVFTFG